MRRRGFAALVIPMREAVYPPEVLATVAWRKVTSERPSRRILVWDADEIVATAGLVWREALLDGRPVLCGGIGGVMTRPDLQRRGLGRMAVDAAAQGLMRERAPTFGVLFCEEKNVGFYERLGWSRFAGEVEVEQPAGRIRYDLMANMVPPLRAAAPAAGLLDLAGLPW